MRLTTVSMLLRWELVGWQHPNWPDMMAILASSLCMWASTTIDLMEGLVISALTATSWATVVLIWLCAHEILVAWRVASMWDCDEWAINACSDYTWLAVVVIVRGGQVVVASTWSVLQIWFVSVQPCEVQRRSSFLLSWISRWRHLYEFGLFNWIWWLLF